MRIRNTFWLLGSALLAAIAHAATPASGTVTADSRMLSFTGGPLLVSNPEGLCDAPMLCDNFALTVTVPANFKQTNPDDNLRITMNFEPAVDMALRLLDAEGNELAFSDNGVGQPESVSAEVVAGTATYTVQAFVFAGAVTSYTTVVELTSAPPPAGPSVAQPFTVFTPPAALGNGAGEPSLGFNLETKKAMFQSGLQVLRATLPEHRSDDPLNPEGLPEVCDALWEDRSGGLATTTTTLDPIGFVDQITGRTFSGQLGPKAHLMEYSDDDGETWNPSVGNTPGLAGVDHQTIGYSPYVSPLPTGIVRNPVTNYPNAVYYCSQDIAYANCSRSDDGGITFGATVNMYTTLECGGLHGHLKGAPDGTVYVPNKGCGAGQGVAVSEDNGLSWNVRTIPNTTPGANDPAVAAGKDGTVYFCYAGADGRPRAVVSRDKGLTWINDSSTGSDLNILTSVFPVAVAGDGDRAACAFLGTTTAGNTEALDFAGVWHTYVAVTYDRGVTWNTTRVNELDPVQGVGGICTSGTTCGANRNLLDFNDMTIDDKGRLLFGYADGCVGACAANPMNIARSEKASFIRLSGARSLYAEFDRATPYRPEGSCLAGTRDSSGSMLTWKAPVDVGNAAISKYAVYRGTSQNALSKIGETADDKPQYTDASADPAVNYFYQVRAINSVGEGVDSNRVLLSLGEVLPTLSPCTLPGVLVSEDAAGDATTRLPQHDVQSVSVAEPFVAGDPDKLYVQLKVGNLMVDPPNTVYYVYFNLGDVQHFLSWDPDVALGGFSYGRNVIDPATGVGSLETDGEADAESVANADGTINIVLTKSKIPALVAGATMAAVSGEARALIGAGGTGLVTPVDSSGAGDYTLVGNSFCLPNVAPQAVLAADRTEGTDRLTVNFTGAGSFDPDAGDRIVEFTFNFGDGSQPVTQTTPTISHDYTSPGNYGATLTVKDSRGVASLRSQPVVIAVKAADTPGGGVIGAPPAVGGSTAAGGRFGGGSLGLALLPLLLLAAARRRRA